MHHIKVTFDKIMNALKMVLGEQPAMLKTKSRPGPKQRFTDLYIIALSLTADYIGIKSENYLFKALNADYKDSFPHLLSRRQYNYRRSLLKDKIEGLQKEISDKMKKQRPTQDTYVIDSAPLRLCRMSRVNRCTICRDDMNLRPEIARCAAHEEWFYGFRLHMVCTGEGIVKAYQVRNPNDDERNYLEEIAANFQNCRIVGDKGYISQERKRFIAETYNVTLETPFKKNMKNQQPFIWHKTRKKIENIFSQLNDQFRLQLNFAKTIEGYLTRINSKICTLTHFINKLNNKPISDIQYALK